MEIIQECDIIECLKESKYYKTFSKFGDDGIKVIHVSPEFVIRNYELQNINTYEEFFNILEKFNFWIIKEFPDEILYWVFDNISKIDLKHLLDSILYDTDIVKQINIIVNGGSDLTKSEAYIELKLAGYYHCAKIANKKGYKSTYEGFDCNFSMNRDYVYNLNKESSELFNKYDKIISKYEYKSKVSDVELEELMSYKNDLILFHLEFYKEFYFEENIHVLLFDHLRHKFKIKYGIMLTLENMKKFLLNFIENYIINKIIKICDT
jgi:hypothetical protein